MKKLIAALMTALMLFSFTGCSFLPAIGALLTQEKTLVAEYEEAIEEYEEAIEDIEEYDDYEETEPEGYDDVFDEDDDFVSGNRFNPVIVFDKRNYYLEITDIDDSDDYYYIFEIEAENRMSDSELVFSLQNCYVNDLSVYASYYNEVSSESRSTEDAYIYISELEDVGIDRVTKLTLQFAVYDDDYNTLDVAMVELYPYGENNAETFERKSEPADKTIIDTREVEITFVGFEGSYGSMVGKFYVENNSDYNIWLTTEASSINGEECYLLVYSELIPGTRGFATMYIDEYDLEDCDLYSYDDIDKIELELALYETDNYELLASKSVTLKP